MVSWKFSSSSQFYIKFLNRIKYFGILRINLEYSKQNEIIQVDYYKLSSRNIFIWLNIILFILLGCHFTSYVYACIKYFIFKQGEKHFMYTFTSTMFSILRILIMTKYNLGLDKLCKLLTEWMQIEQNVGNLLGKFYILVKNYLQ